MAFDNSATGPALGAISQNVANSMFGVAASMDAVFYVMGLGFFVLFLILAWKHHDKKDSWANSDHVKFVSTYILALCLSVLSFAAPTLLGGSKSTIFGDQTQSLPGPSFVE